MDRYKVQLNQAIVYDGPSHGWAKIIYNAAVKASAFGTGPDRATPVSLFLNDTKVENYSPINYAH